MRSATATIFFFWPFSNGPWSRNTFNRYHTHTTRFSVTQRFIDGRLGRTYLWPINLAPLCYVSEVYSLLETKQNTKKVKKTAIAVTITHPHTNNKEPIILFFSYQNGLVFSVRFWLTSERCTRTGPHTRVYFGIKVFTTLFPSSSSKEEKPSTRRWQRERISNNSRRWKRGKTAVRQELGTRSSSFRTRR